LWGEKDPHFSGNDKGPQSDRDMIGTETHAANLLWDGLCYDVKVKDGPKRLLDDVEGWIKPGTLTALIGASGAGKTTLLNILANRSSAGVIGGEKLVDVKYQDDGFARKVGYAQQEDLHLATTTVREALTFSARLRQPRTYSDVEKLTWVEEVIDTLDMSGFSEAVIGVPGEGLNVEQRKRVTIGVELAARPELLLFLDEPTSGLDSNTAWSVCTLLRKLADNGQAILCTIHQPSEILFRMFDRLLFLVDGKSVYFGDIGPDSRILIHYFEGHGSRKCGVDENPAEWLLDVTGTAQGPNQNMAWSEVWYASQERQEVKKTLEAMKKSMIKEVAKDQESTSSEFATSFIYQLYIVTRRNFECEWRTPSYLYSKLFLTLGAVSISSMVYMKVLTYSLGLDKRIFFLSLREQPPRCSEPDLFGLPSFHVAQQSCPIGIAAFYREPDSVRDTRAPVPNLFLVGVHFIQLHCGGSVANASGCYSVCNLVLSYWDVSQRVGD
jgi:ATP-binding cassette, subfamily G (WHITE), member 2, PDR